MGKIASIGLAPLTGGASLIPGVGDAVGGFLGDPAGKLTSSAPTVNSGVTQPQINTAYDQTQAALQQQTAFLQALQAQNGIGNQSSVFNQLQGVANGTGPNPALAQLNQTTGQNVANQAALMASARGAQSNPGEIARLAAQQGGNLQQQAVGQAATLQAQQQLGALNQLGGVAGQQVAQQQNALTGANQFAQGQQQNLLSAVGNANTANASINMNNANNKNKTIGGLLNGGGSALSMLAAAHGGEIPEPQYMNQGGSAGLGANININGSAPQAAAPQYSVMGAPQPAPAFATLGASPLAAEAPGQMDPVQAFMSGQPYVDSARQGLKDAQTALASNKPAPISFGGDPKDPVNQGLTSMGSGIGSVIKTLAASKGAVVPGKAKMKGDSLKNDTVPAILSPGEIVIPRSIAQGKDAPEKAKQFVAAIMRKKGRKNLG